jgi:hypothetical protein
MSHIPNYTSNTWKVQSCANDDKSIRLRLKVARDNRPNRFAVEGMILAIERDPQSELADSVTTLPRRHANEVIMHTA